jgi:hypothetical protein
MSGKKAHPERVIPQLLERAIETCKERNSLFSEYIVFHFRATGNLAPGCDARDFYVALDQRHPHVRGDEIELTDEVSQKMP